MKKILCILFLFVYYSTPRTWAQTTPAPDATELTKTILSLDSVFWKAYNTCDVEGMARFFTNDIEFYHDKGGLTSGSAELLQITRNNLCNNKDWWLRREVVKGSLRVYPMDNYGAILTGEHVFYINQTGKKEYLDGRARFTHVWRFKDNEWKMHRVLSFDHRPAESAD